MTTEQQNIIKEFFDVSRYDTMDTRADLIGLGELISIEKLDNLFLIKVKGLPELNVENLTSHQITTLTTWMKNKIAFVNNLRRHYFTDELKDLKTIYLEGCYRYVDVAVIIFNNDFRSYEADRQNTLLKNTIRSVGFGSGQKFGEIILIHYKPHYYTLNRWKRYRCDLVLGMQWDANKPYKWAL